MVGKFPEHFDVKDLVSPSEKKALLAKSHTWEWEVGPEQDADGQVTKFHLDKEVLNPDDNQAYVVTEKIYGYGDQVMINDDEDSVIIQCNIPAN